MGINKRIEADSDIDIVRHIGKEEQKHQVNGKKRQMPSHYYFFPGKGGKA